MRASGKQVVDTPLDDLMFERCEKYDKIQMV